MNRYAGKGDGNKMSYTVKDERQMLLETLRYTGNLSSLGKEIGETYCLQFDDRGYGPHGESFDAGAAIAGTKISPDFGSQNIVTTGYITTLRTICLVPEFDNALARPDGTSNRGTLTTGYDSTNRHSYYHWTTNEPVVQDYDIIARVRVPDGYSSFI